MGPHSSCSAPTLHRTLNTSRTKDNHPSLSHTTALSLAPETAGRGRVDISTTGSSHSSPKPTNARTEPQGLSQSR